MIYGQNAGYYNGFRTKAFHPGWNVFNWLACEVGSTCGGTKPYSFDESPGWHPVDLGLRDPGTAAPCDAGTFDVPWDNYGITATYTTPTTTTITRDFGTFGGGSSAKVTQVPTMALDASGCTLPTNSTVTISSGTTDASGKGGDLSVAEYAYIEKTAPYPSTAKNNGTIITWNFDLIDNDGGDITLFTCEPVTATTCTIIDAVQTTVSDGLNTGLSLTITPGSYIGYWNPATNGAIPDTASGDSGHPDSAGVIKRTTAIVSDPFTNIGNGLTYQDDPVGNFSNSGAIIETTTY